MRSAPCTVWQHSCAAPWWGRCRAPTWLSLLLALISLLAGPVGAQTTQPAGRFEHELVRTETGRNRAAGVATTAPAQVQMTSVKFDWPRVAVALGTVIGLIFVMKYIARRWLGVASATGAGRVVRILGRATTAPRQQVVLIQVGRRIIVAADNGGQMNALCQITDADEVALLLGPLEQSVSTPSNKGFRNWIKQAADEFGDEPEAQPALAGAPIERVESSSTGSDPTLETARGEIAGLMDKVRGLARQYRK